MEIIAAHPILCKESVNGHNYPIDGFMVFFAYLSSTPRLLREVIKRLAAYQLHGIDYAPSHGSHVTALIA